MLVLMWRGADLEWTSAVAARASVVEWISRSKLGPGQQGGNGLGRLK